MNSKEMTEIQFEELTQKMEQVVKQAVDQAVKQAVEPLIAENQQLRTKVEQLNEQIATTPKTRISLAKAAHMIGKAEATIRTLAQAGKLPSHKVGNHRIFYQEEIIEWMHGKQNKDKKEEEKKETPVATPKSSKDRLHPKYSLAPTAPKQRRRAKPVNR
ncbi:MAG: helix-turn-helix domain-containing protein [Rikenellaceae bacterium]